MNVFIFRWVLLGIIVALLGGIGYGFVFLSSMLETKVNETDHAKIDLSVADFELQKLKRLSTVLKDQQEIIERAREIVATGKSYQYQDQVIADITTYAKEAGVTIQGFSFPIPTAAGAKKETTPTGTESKIAIAINLGSPLPYVNFMKFISQIEKNLTKIQVVSVNLSPEGKDPKLVNNPSIGIELYIKK